MAITTITSVEELVLVEEVIRKRLQEAIDKAKMFFNDPLIEGDPEVHIQLCKKERTYLKLRIKPCQEILNYIKESENKKVKNLSQTCNKLASLTCEAQELIGRTLRLEQALETFKEENCNATLHAIQTSFINDLKMDITLALSIMHEEEKGKTIGIKEEPENIVKIAQKGEISNGKSDQIVAQLSPVVKDSGAAMLVNQNLEKPMLKSATQTNFIKELETDIKFDSPKQPDGEKEATKGIIQQTESRMQAVYNAKNSMVKSPTTVAQESAVFKGSGPQIIENAGRKGTDSSKHLNLKKSLRNFGKSLFSVPWNIARKAVYSCCLYMFLFDYTKKEAESKIWISNIYFRYTVPQRVLRPLYLNTFHRK